MSEKLPKKLPDFYKYIIYVMFAVVLAQSFPQSTSVFIPLSKIGTYEGLENALVAITVYSFIVTSWMGYFLSITKNPHKETSLGTLRFGIDIFIIYLFYYLLSIAPDTEYHKEIFIWVLPLIFSTFLVWDTVKYLEYRNESEEKSDRINRTIITALFLFFLIIQSLLYIFVIPVLLPLTYGTSNVWNTVFVVSSLVILTLYRWRKRHTFRMKSRRR